MDELKAWVCKACAAQLGKVRRNPRGVRQLLLYRQAVQLEDESPVEVEVMAVVDGTAYDVVCSCCGSVRTWVMGEEALRQMLESAGREMVEIEYERKVE